MSKGIYTYYKERLIEIGGNNKCLYQKTIVRKGAYDIGRIFEGRDDKVAELTDFLWSGRRYPLTLLSQAEEKAISDNLDMQTKFDKKNKEITAPVAPSRVLEREIAAVRDLKREIEEIERETGRYELYVGYPFVFGSIPQGPKKMLIKAPLLLFPVRIDFPDESTVELVRDETEKIQINKALIFAYAQAKRLNVDNLELEFDDMSGFKGVRGVTDYLAAAHIRIDCQTAKNVYNYQKFKEPDTRTGLSVRYAAVLARYPLSNSIYSDYSLLEQKNLTNDAINELLRPKKAARHAVKNNGKPHNNYVVKRLDYAQSEVVRKADENGNMVIYGPPGTGKSQTIVNIISDAVVKKKRVLVVSQKKAALDVVYNRLGVLNEKAMYLTDESKEKQSFYDRCLNAHQQDMIESLTDVESLERNYNELEQKIQSEVAQLNTIFDTLHQKRPFGLSLAEMYDASYMLQKSSSEYTIYQKLVENPAIMSLTYKELSDALFVIRQKNLENLYYTFVQDKEKNPIIDHMKPDIDLNTLSEVKAQLEDISRSRKGLFNTAKHPYYRQVLAYYYEIKEKRNLAAVVRMTAKFEHPGKVFLGKVERQTEKQLCDTLADIESFVKEYDCLHRVLSEDGYLAVIDNILRGNTQYVRLVRDALENYISLRDINNLLESLDNTKLTILNFAYTISKSYQNYHDILEKLLVIRIYHEVAKHEEECKDNLSKMVDYVNITARISQLKEQQLVIANKICSGKNSKEYDNLYANAKNNKDYLYQISKKKNYWPIRRTLDVYADFILALFPCWLLSPENVSSLLPLHKNMFDIVIFDEASQVFIESTIPTIYRGKNIIVAGDSKQLRPSATFMKRYLGGDPENQDDYSMQAALEVDSLLDLAISRYESANLTYHYRSRYSELIAFSNAAFYGAGLQIAPNISRHQKTRPMERYKVNGRWIDRRNLAEADKVVELLRKVLYTRGRGETIGIITFNSDQQSCIADAIDREALRDPDFRQRLERERNRKENGEDVSLFIKNLENVQGDERDIIIFSIGYAPNEQGKVYTNFGSLSTEGGENRLNVAITRAKTKILLVTSIEPEELRVDTTKNLGPKLLRDYLAYVRAVAEGDRAGADAILSRLSPAEHTAPPLSGLSPIEEQMKARLEKLGYSVELHLGNRKNRLSLAIYDPDTDRYLVGVELDRDACLASDSILERDVYKPRFLESRGWTVIRVFSRDWWISPAKVIRAITNAAEKNRKHEG